MPSTTAMSPALRTSNQFSDNDSEWMRRIEPTSTRQTSINDTLPE